MKSKFLSITLLIGSLLPAFLNAAPAAAPAPIPVPNARPARPIPPTPMPPPPRDSDLLVWDATMKEMTVALGQTNAVFIFNATNVSDTLVVIDSLKPSCHCTTGALPSTPWLLPPHADGKISVTVDLAGKFGTVFKTIGVISTNAPKVLTVKVIIPEDPVMARSRNLEMAKADRQAVLRGQCAECHVEKGRGKMGQELYAASCGICHDAEHRASTVPNLHALNHSTDYNYWRAWITTGKAGTMMPGFALEQGGSLNEAEILSVAKYLSETVPANPTPAKVVEQKAK
jgi:hypothetical protein